ncbi:hypothetical protein ACWC5I_44165, partial [Kitasatospora sp. NPDC001574]
CEPASPAGASAAVPAPVTPVTPAAASSSAAVGGSVRIAYAYAPDDDIRFVFDVEGVPFSRPTAQLPQGLPTDARGTVRISHHVTAQGRTVTSEAAVDCLVTGGRTASFTAVVVRADPELADTVGQRRGFSVVDGAGDDGQPDRVGFSWGVANADTDEAGGTTEGRAGTCMAPAPFAPSVSGDLTVRHAELPPFPVATATATATPVPANASTAPGTVG